MQLANQPAKAIPRELKMGQGMLRKVCRGERRQKRGSGRDADRQILEGDGANTTCPETPRMGDEEETVTGSRKDTTPKPTSNEPDARIVTGYRKIRTPNQTSNEPNTTQTNGNDDRDGEIGKRRN